MLKEVVLTLFEVLSRNFKGWTEESHENPQDNHCPGGVSNLVFPECPKRCRWCHALGSTLHNVAIV